MKFILTTIFHIISIFKWIWKKIICCGKRQKDTSVLPFTLDTNVNTVKYSVPNNDVEMESWDNWDNETKKPEDEEEVSAEIDYFTGMTPTFVKAKKVLVKANNHHNGNQSLFTVKSDITMTNVGSELGTWDDAAAAASASSWGDEATEDITAQCNETVKEKRDRERHARRQYRQNSKEISVS